MNLTNTTYNSSKLCVSQPDIITHGPGGSVRTRLNQMHQMHKMSASGVFGASGSPSTGQTRSGLFRILTTSMDDQCAVVC